MEVGDFLNIHCRKINPNFCEHSRSMKLGLACPT